MSPGALIIWLSPESILKQLIPAAAELACGYDIAWLSTNVCVAIFWSDVLPAALQREINDVRKGSDLQRLSGYL